MPNNQNNKKKYASLSTLQTFLDNLKTKFSNIGHKHTISDLTDYTVDSSLSSTSTNPVQNKVLNAEFDEIAVSMRALDLALDGKADSTHNHDDDYAEKTHNHDGVYAPSAHHHDSKYDTKGSAAAVQTNLDTVSDTLDAHTKNTDVHVTTANKTNWNSAYTHSTSAHARTDATKVEDSTTNGNIKINGTETNVYSHPNSGVTAGTYKSVTVNAQGHVTGGSNPTTLAGYGITDAETKTDASAKLTEAKTYADNAATKVKNDLLNGAGTAYDTLKELGDLIDENVDAIDALETVAAGKADKTHTHAIADVSGLQSALDGKAASSHGTHVSYSTTAPVMDGTASVGSASTVARSDHKHPTDTSRASKTEFDTHNSDTTKHITSTERTNWNAAKTHADSAHAPSNAEKNQNAFSNIAVSGQTTVAADTATDTVTFVGSNVTITTDATNDKVTFSVADGSTSGKGVVQLTNSTSSTSTTTAATPSSVKSAYDLANTAKTNAATAQSRADAAYTLANGKVDSLSDLGVTATAAELNYMDGVTSNVQTQLDSKLSTSGGTISGVITTTDGDAFNRNVTTSGTYYYGGTGFDDGAFLGLYGKDQSNYAGEFRLKADNGNSFVYLEGRPDGQLIWDGRNVAILNSSGALDIADGGTGARSSSGALANLGGVPLAGGEMTGALKLPKLSATSTDAYIGSMTVPFQQVYTKNVYIQDGKNDTVSYGDFRAQTTGTTSVVGKAQLDVGNSTKTGTAGNARGIVRIYGTGAYYHQIQGDATSNRTLTLPNKTGTLATTDDVTSVATMTTAEYNALGSDEINANTLYMLTDGDDRADWSQNDETAENYIKNKPDIDGIVDGLNIRIDETLESIASITPDKIGAATSDHNHNLDYDAFGSADAALVSSKEYTNTKVAGLISANEADNKITNHNVATDSHNDIRLLISDLTTKLNNFLDVDDTTVDQLSEVLTLIDANRDSLESLLGNKVNVSDIIDNLTTNVSNKVLSASQGVALKTLIDALQEEVDKKALASDLTAHTGNKSNPHGVTAAQVGLGNVDNTSDANKPVSTAQATAIADAKSAGTSAQTNLDTHISNKSNPHGVTLSQLGVTASAAELNYMGGVTSSVQTQLNNKVTDYTIRLYNGTGGNPKPVKFLTINYSNCDSNNGVMVKVGMVSGHGNGISYTFLQDVIINVSYTGTISADNFKYYGASVTDSGVERQYGDIFWIHDSTNKIVDFYVLMGQYADVKMMPFKRLNSSSGGTVTQYTSCTVYSSGTKVWANNSDIALISDVNTKAPMYTYSTTDLTAGTSSLTTGKMYLVYE